MTVGVPLPKGVVQDGDAFVAEKADGRFHRVQSRTVDRWGDGSARWVLLDWLASTHLLPSVHIAGSDDTVNEPMVQVRVVEEGAGVTVDTGRIVVSVRPGAAFPFADVQSSTGVNIDGTRSGLFVDFGRGQASVRVTAVTVEERGPIRAQIRVAGEAAESDGNGTAYFVARLEMFAGAPAIRAAITIGNRRRATHPSGYWVLGDRGSLYLRSAVLVLSSASAIESARVQIEEDGRLESASLPWELFQESSGGEQWSSPVHRIPGNDTPLRFRGYRVRSAGSETHGFRASPTVVAQTTDGALALAMPQSWQNFPRAIEVGATGIVAGLFPRQADRLHELQGGEQKTHRLTISIGTDHIGSVPLEWCHTPLLFTPGPDWSCASGAIRYLVPESQDGNTDYLTLVNRAIDARSGFAAKQESIDEYGWRHFGDLYADHETAGYTGSQPFVSHYNNQYDAVAGFALHFLRTGDIRWWRLMTDLARHVIDIDIYHTEEDKSAYNGGLFWHTYHYLDAGLSTHRTYPREAATGGGPSAEHNYTNGLTLHYFLTGDPAAREAALGLAGWVMNMDDGAATALRWVAPGPTGLASATGSLTYHGPGRGAANSIVACLNAFRLSHDRIFQSKAETLIRRCIHPDDDVDARDLHDAERRWYYTVFLQALGTFLDDKREREEIDGMFAYARGSLLRYARWMATHEYPYLDRPERLEYPNETWAAQDMRKAEVFLSAALHVDGNERQLFLERARFFFNYSTRALLAFPTSHFARPIVLLLTNGIRDAWFQVNVERLPPPDAAPVTECGGPSTFVPQKIVALRRMRMAGLAATGLVVVGVLLCLLN